MNPRQQMLLGGRDCPCESEVITGRLRVVACRLPSLVCNHQAFLTDQANAIVSN